MKKLIILTLLCFGLVVPAIAQDAEGGKADPKKTRRGLELLPKAGDISLGISANPFLGYLGGFMGGNSTANVPGFNGVDGYEFKDQQIYMKYFLEDNVAVRAKLHMNFSKTKNKETVRDDHAYFADPTNSAATAIDTKIKSINEIGLNLGYEMRRGRGRVQGFYGGEVLLGYGRTNYSYEYGNPITEANQEPTTAASMGLNPTKGYRELEEKGGRTFYAGLGAFVGVEYYFTPMISIGGELGLGFIYKIKGQDEIKTEGYLGDGVQEYEYRARKFADDAFQTGFGTKATGSIFVMFHF